MSLVCKVGREQSEAVGEGEEEKRDLSKASSPASPPPELVGHFNYHASNGVCQRVCAFPREEKEGN